jgi:hypothetical protein
MQELLLQLSPHCPHNFTMFSQVFGILDSNNKSNTIWCDDLAGWETHKLLEEKMKRFSIIKGILGAIFYVALLAVAGTLIYRSGWSSGFMASGAGDPGAGILASGTILAWSIGILAAILVAGALVRLVARSMFGMAYMHGHPGHFGRFGRFHGHRHPMHSFGPGFGPDWKMRHGCGGRGMPGSAEMEEYFKKWEEHHGEVPEHWRKVAEAAVEARKTDEAGDDENSE